MKSPKYILFVGIFFIFIVTVLFFNIFKEYTTEIKIINKELTGIHKIIKLHNLNISLKILRGLTQLDEQDAKQLKNTLSIKEDDIYDQTQKTAGKTVANDFQSVIKSKNLSSLELFSQYSNLIKKLDKLRLETSEKYFLFFEHNKESYYLMMLSSLKIPEAIEYIGRLRGLISGVLSNKTSYEKVETQTEINIGYFLEKMEEIRYFTQKLPADKAAILNQKINTIMENFYQIKEYLAKISHNKCKMTPKEYFLKASKLVGNINELFIATQKMLLDNLTRTKHVVTTKIYINIVIYLLLTILSFYITYRIYRKTKMEKLAEEKEKEEQKLKNLIRNEFMKNPSLKELCYVFLSQITRYFDAVNSSLYIYDNKNNKLYLGAVYGIDEDKIKKTLGMHENIIGEVVNEKTTKITPINQDINLGNITIKGSYFVTIPMLELKQCMGAIQLCFDEKFKNIDLEFLKETANLISSYIYKAQKDEISKNYLDLIDKYVLISKTDYDGIITEASSYFCQTTGFDKNELIGKTHAIIRHPDTTDETIKKLWETIKQKKVWVGEMKNRKKSGDAFWAYTIITPDLDLNGNIIGFTAIRTDITDKKRIEQISITDGLTSLYNRRHFDDIFPKQLRIAKRENTHLAFAMIDIDKFKQYNDIYGHQEGDNAIKAVSSVLKNVLNRADDYSFRLGGEEFGLLFKAKNKHDAYNICEKAKTEVENLNIEHKGNTAKPILTISIGIVFIHPSSSTSVDDIYKLADKALYEAKNTGRNRIEIIELDGSLIV